MVVVSIVQHKKEKDSNIAKSKVKRNYPSRRENSCSHSFGVILFWAYFQKMLIVILCFLFNVKIILIYILYIFKLKLN